MGLNPTTINITPTWVAILPALLAALEDGTEEGKRMAREELKHMAQVADLAKDAGEKRDELIKALEYIAAGYRVCSNGLEEFITDAETLKSIARATVTKIKGRLSLSTARDGTVHKDGCPMLREPVSGDCNCNEGAQS